MKQGALIMPPDSAARVNHYWDWEDYLMDEICPSLPLFTGSTVQAYWDNFLRSVLQTNITMTIVMSDYPSQNQECGAQCLNQ